MLPPDELFEPFGAATVTEVHRQIRRSGTLGPLLRQLGLESPRTMEEQCQVLLRYLEAYGSIYFLNQVSLTDPANTAIRRVAGVPPARPVSPEGVQIPRSAAGPSTTGRLPEPPAASQATPGPELSAPDGRKWIDVPGYKGPDRRSGEERRQGPRDRRESLETVFRNRRYGGWDRRKAVRREEDRLKGGK